jgi:hypothetical protein
MKQLKELVQIVTRHRQPKPDFIDEDFLGSDIEHITSLYHGIRQGKINTDQAAAQEIYGSSLIDTKYTTLKSRLKSKLLNTLFFLNITRQDYSEMTVAYYKVSKMIFWMRTLSVLGAIRTSIKIGETIIGLCEKYQFIDQIIHMLMQLRRHYGVTGNSKLYELTDAKLKSSSVKLNDELIAREYYERASLQLTKSTVVSDEFLTTVVNYYNELLQKISDDNTFEFRLCTYRVGIYAFQLKHEYSSVINISDSAIQYLENNPLFSSTIRLGEFNLQKMESCLYIRDYDLGERTANRCEELLPQGRNLWFLYKETYFLLAMQTEHYQRAAELYSVVTSHERFQFQLDQTKERWKIFELYLTFALRVKKLSSEMDSQKASFDLKRFLRNVPVYAHDKRGLNIAILIIHVILLLEEDDFGSIISRMDALRTYRTRYLRSRTAKQSALFFRMLQIMEDSSFSYKETEKRTRKLYDQLLTIATDTTEIQEGIMILRFETLWKMILDLLEKKEREGVIRV